MILCKVAFANACRYAFPGQLLQKLANFNTDRAFRGSVGAETMLECAYGLVLVVSTAGAVVVAVPGGGVVPQMSQVPVPPPLQREF